MKLVIPMLVAALTLAGCATVPPWVEKAFPRAAAGYEAGGVLGAIDGATGTILVICRKLDGETFTASVDYAAEVFTVEDEVAYVRNIRKKICEGVGAIAVLVEAATAKPVANPDGSISIVTEGDS